LAGICRATVKPAVTPTAGYAIEDEKVVLVITVPKGSQPIYYCDNRPYVRHLSESRPAEPHQIVDLVRSWIGATDVINSDDEDKSSPELLTELVRVITDILIYGKEIEQRDINPWLDLVLTQFRYAAATLRQLAALPVAIEYRLAPELESLADDLDEILGQPIVSGYWPRFQDSVNKAVSKAREIKAKFFDSETMSRANVTSAKEAILSDARKLRSLDKRMERLAEQGRLDEDQGHAFGGWTNVAATPCKTKDMHLAAGPTSPLLRAAGELVERKNVKRSGTALLCHGAKINRTLSGAGLNSCDLAQIVARCGRWPATLRCYGMATDRRQLDAMRDSGSCRGVQPTTVFDQAKPQRLFQTGGRLGTSDAAAVGRFQ
jgi:hypothetical protein